MPKRLLIGAAVAAVTGVVSFLGGAFSGGGTRPALAVTRGQQDALAQLVQGFSTGSTAGFVKTLERRVARDPKEANALALLGFAYQQRARETGDPAFYSLAERALTRSLRAGAESSLIDAGLASLAVARHRFREALPLARRAVRLNPENGTAYAALGDSLEALGRYREAFRTFDLTVRLSPSVASYARVAHARELLGHSGAAIEALELALDLTPVIPEHKAWTLVQLGNLQFNVGRLEQAKRAYRRALAEFPDYVHADAGLARVEAARGRYARAITRLRRVVEILPLPQYAVALGDVLRAAGRPGEAQQAYALVGAIQRLFEANGVRTELQTALFDVDHGIDLPQALVKARRAYAERPSIDGDDVLAWALERNGRCAEALPYSEHALHLGTQDALKFFHRGMIEQCLGRVSAARAWFQRALELNPHFSLLWAPVARRSAS